MQGVALVGVFLRLTPFAARAGLDRDALLAAVRPSWSGSSASVAAVVEANLELVAAAYDGVIDVTAALAERRGTRAGRSHPMTRRRTHPDRRRAHDHRPGRRSARGVSERRRTPSRAAPRQRPAGRRRDGSLVGVLTQTNLAHAVPPRTSGRWPGLTVRHLMSHPAVTVHRAVPLTHAVRQMERLRIHRLIVVAA